MEAALPTTPRPAAKTPASTRDEGVLPRREAQILRALAEAAIPRGEILPAGDGAACARLEGWLRAEGAALTRAFRGLLWALEVASLPTHGRRFSRLGLLDRIDFLDGWTATESTASRALLVALLTPLKGMYAESEAIHAKLGLPFGVRPPERIEQPGYLANALDGGELRDDDELECDVVVVGSGAGGGPVAYELARRGHAVLVIEAGAYFDRRHFDGRTSRLFRQLYLERGMTIALGNVGVPVWAGRTVGGTTTVNSGTCYRTPDSVLREWGDELGLDMLTPDVMRPRFQAAEAMLGVEEAPREWLGTIAGVVARGADALGWHHGPLRRNAPGCDGQGLCCFGCPTGAKRSADVSWIPAALERGATLLYRTRVDRVDVDGSGRAVGVTARSAGGAALKIRARATVIAGGALMTPVLLARSGLCRGSRWLGRNLSIHPAGKAMALFSERQDMWRGIPQSYCVEEFRREGIMLEGGSLPFTAAASGLTQVGPAYTRLLERYRDLSLFGFMIRDRSRGRVVARPGGKGPAIFYDMGADDARRFQRGQALLAELYLEAGAEAVYPGIMGCPPVRSRRDLEALRADRFATSRFEVTAFHPLGTARMSARPEDGVVGPDHETHEHPGLYVVDGAAVPSSLGVNPQITIMALGLRAAAILDRRLSFS